MTRGDITRMAREAGLFNQYNDDLLQDKEVMAQFERFAALVAAAEREACHALRQTLPNPYEHCQVSAHAYRGVRCRHPRPWEALKLAWYLWRYPDRVGALVGVSQEFMVAKCKPEIESLKTLEQEMTPSCFADFRYGGISAERGCEDCPRVVSCAGNTKIVNKKFAEFVETTLHAV